MELVKEKHGNYYEGANRARNKLYSDLRILRINLEEGTFTGEVLPYGSQYSNLKMSEFYFFEFH